MLIFGEITPKTIAIYGAYGYARVAVKPLRLVIFLSYPVTIIVVWFLSKAFPKYSNWNSRLGSSTSMEEIDSYFTLGEEVGIIEGDEKEPLFL